MFSQVQFWRVSLLCDLKWSYEDEVPGELLVSLSHSEVLMICSYPCVDAAQELRGCCIQGNQASNARYLSSHCHHDTEVANGGWGEARKNKHRGGLKSERLPRGCESTEGSFLQSLGVPYPQASSYLAQSAQEVGKPWQIRSSL